MAVEVRFASRAILVVSLLVWGAAASFAADTTFRVLVSPPPSTPRPLPDVQPDHMRAVVGSTPYKVNAVEKDERLSTAPIVIVADFVNTAPRYHPCVVSEVIPLMRKLESRPGVTLLANGAPSEFVHHFEIGSGPGGVNLLLSKYDDANLRKWCEDVRSTEPEVRFADPYYAIRGSETLWGVIKGWDGSNRLVRVFWVSGDFTWFDAADTTICPDKPEAANCKPNSRKRDDYEKLTSRYVAGLSKAGVSIFPILIPGTKNSEIPDKRRREPFLAAQYLAAVAGGFALNSEGETPGTTLERAVTATDQSYSVELSGPPSQDVAILSIAAPPLTWQRPYVVDPRDAISEEIRKLPFRAERVFVPSHDFGVRYGCATGCQDPNSPSLTLLLPEFVMTATPGNVYTLVEYVQPALPFKYRRTLQRGPEGCLCIPIEELTDRLEFRIIVYDETTQWLAAATMNFQKRK